MPIHIEIQNIQEAIAGLQQFAAGFQQDVIAPAVDQALNEALQGMQSSAPVDTGFLRDNIVITANSETGGEIVSEAPYSGFVEFGHRTRGGGGIGFVPAQPFFEPEVIILQETFPQQLEADLADYISGIFG